MSVLSKKIFPKLLPIARKVNEMSAALGHEHIHVWNHGDASMSTNGRPIITQKCELCGKTRIIPLQ